MQEEWQRYKREDENFLNSFSGDSRTWVETTRSEIRSRHAAAAAAAAALDNCFERLHEEFYFWSTSVILEEVKRKASEDTTFQKAARLVGCFILLAFLAYLVFDFVMLPPEQKANFLKVVLFGILSIPVFAGLAAGLFLLIPVILGVLFFLGMAIMIASSFILLSMLNQK